MWEYPKKGLMGRVMRVVRYIIGLRIPVYASHASFFIVLSVFPTLVLLLSLLRYTGLEVENLTGLLHGVLPTALMPAAQKLIINTYNSTTGTVVSISALTALWSASRGIHGLVTGLNTIYGVAEDRGYWYTRLVSVVYMFLFLLLFVQTMLFTAMFMVLPNKRNKLMDSFPGAVLASIGWLVFSHIYSIYVENFAGLSTVYGSVYAVALSMLWLYCCISIVFYGGALNHWLMDNKDE